MTSTQEFLNSISMVLPTLVFAMNAWYNPSRFLAVLLVGSSMHLPVSFTYHLGVAFHRYPDRLDNDMRRLDQSLQHVMGILFSFALSGSLGYALLNLLFNLYGIVQLWDARTSNDGRRWMPVLISILLYTAPMLWRGDVSGYSLAITSVALGGFPFIPRFNHSVFCGWGHAIFHVVLMIHAQALSHSASGMNQE